jgi:hypothetical protein
MRGGSVYPVRRAFTKQEKSNMQTIFYFWLGGFFVWLGLCLYTFAMTPEMEQQELRSPRALAAAIFMSILWPLFLLLAIADFYREDE